jgi:ketosteroid isomerase-like protein
VSQASMLQDLFRSIDAKDSARFVRFLTPDATFRFGNAPAIAGHAAIEQAVAGFFASLKALNHRLLATWEESDSLALHGEVTYTRHDSSQITLPFANVFRLRDGLISEYLIYADVAPLYAPPV